MSGLLVYSTEQTDSCCTEAYRSARLRDFHRALQYGNEFYPCGNVIHTRVKEYR